MCFSVLCAASCRHGGRNWLVGEASADPRVVTVTVSVLRWWMFGPALESEEADPSGSVGLADPGNSPQGRAGLLNLRLVFEPFMYTAISVKNPRLLVLAFRGISEKSV